MRSTGPAMLLALALIVAFTANLGLGAEPKASKSSVREGAYYEFRGRMSDRNTLEKTFTLGWDKGSQVIAVAGDTKVDRYGRGAKLDDAKSGDAVRGFGRVLKGRLVAIAVAFGDEGVELPPGIKIPESITLPASDATD